jgi:hypothetical protein
MLNKDGKLVELAANIVMARALPPAFADRCRD